MSPSPHLISRTSFSGLATSGGGAKAVGELCAAQESKHRLLVGLLAAEAGAHPHAALVARAYEALSEMAEGAPEEIRRLFRHPAVGAWALSVCRGHAAPGRLAAVALAAAVRTRTACRLDVPVGGPLMLPSVGLLSLPGDLPEVAEVSVEPAEGGAELRVGGRTYRVDVSGDRPGWQVLHRVPVAPGVTITIDDLDPYRWPEDDADGRLSGERRRTWVSCLHEAWEILNSRHLTVAGEVAAAVSVLTPVVARTTDQHSASARVTFGTIALSDPIDGMGMALTLAHELQHAKLDALSALVELTLPDDGRRFYAPWRPDPRPLFSLLHGVYAHAGVAGFWRRHTQDPEHGTKAQVEFAHWREAAYQASRTLLDSGGLTEAGTHFVVTLHDTLGRWRAEPVTPAAAAQARLRSEHHRRAWVRTNTQV
ncbi:HEXXH motif domain-containing protein [Nonomuraea sp. NPDC050786]|uniref:HEXXH motif domain-containing protein n=1 Tax=Nonomuraea sp. NPDC050786 TaxID=3154840 RepID=UPI0033D6EE09